MRAELKYDGQNGWLCLPYEYNAPVTDVCVADSKGKRKTDTNPPFCRKGGPLDVVSFE